MVSLSTNELCAGSIFVADRAGDLGMRAGLVNAGDPWKRCPRVLAALVAAQLSLTCAAFAAERGPLWNDFQVVIWQPKTAKQYGALKELGFTAAMVQADRNDETEVSVRRKVAPIVQSKLRPYVENISTDFYSAYHRWTPGKPVNAAFIDLQKTIAAHPGNKTVFVRRPSLSDPRELLAIRTRIAKIVRLYAPYRPLFFDLGDEMGIADLSAAWDFDFSPYSLSGMRRWLRRQYGSLSALNVEWGSNFPSWEDVVPPTTTETMMRADENFAAWSDFKAWMDVTFARAIRTGSEAVHAGARWALAGMEGAQMPGWGGYDYSKLASSVDVMELYDASQSLELAQAFNPNLITLTTIDWAQNYAPYSAWHALLRGVRGMIVWDSNDQLVHLDGSVGPAGRTAMPFLRELKQAPATLIMDSRPIHSPIAVLYSPQSYRLQWLLDHRSMGASWTRLSSEDQNADNAVRAAQRRVLRLLDLFGLTPHFIDDRQLSSLENAAYKIIVLPQSLALSSKATDALGAFVSRGGILILEGQTGLYDQHGRRLAQPRFSAMSYGNDARALKLSDDDIEAVRQLTEALRAADIKPPMRIEDPGKKPSAVIERYLYRKGGFTIAAFLRKPAAGAPPIAYAQIVLPHTAYVYDVRAERFLTRADRFTIAVESSIPTILAISRNPMSAKICQSVLHWHKCASISRAAK